jgi:hypothetical protein
MLICVQTSLFPFNDRMHDYLAATKRSEIGDFARVFAKELQPDENAEARLLFYQIVPKC